MKEIIRKREKISFSLQEIDFCSHMDSNNLRKCGNTHGGRLTCDGTYCVGCG